MAVNFKNLSIASVLSLAAASLTLPAVAEAQDRGGWRGAAREDGGNRGNGEGRRGEGNGGGNGGGWQQRSQTPAPQGDGGGNRGWAGRSAPAPQGDGGASRGWAGRSAPAPQATAPQAPSQAGWGREGGNRGNWEGRGNRDQSRGDGLFGMRRGENRGQATAPSPTGDRSRGWSGNDSSTSRDGRYNGGVATSPRSGWSGSDRTRDGSRDGTLYRDRDRYRDNDRYGDNHRYRDNDRYRDGSRYGDRYRYGDNHRHWDRRWRDNNRYNWYTYRTRYPSYYRIGVYHSPYRNYSYRRLSIGFFLDSLFYSDRYWISDPWQYRLPDAYGPYRWVRYYDDALLVDIYSGEVVDVIHDFFW